jgi:hypothetical protein
MICSISGRVGLLAGHLDIDRHLAPAMDGVAIGEDLALDDDAAALLRAQIRARQEDHGDAELADAGDLALLADIVLEEVLRDLHVDAGAIAGLAIGIDGAAVPHGLQRSDRRFHHLPARLAIDGSDEADTAGIMLLGRIVEALRLETRGVRLPLGGEVLAGRLVRVLHGTIRFEALHYSRYSAAAA